MDKRPELETIDWLAALQARRKRCQAIALKARAAGLDVTWVKVNKHYQWFCRWDEGRLATGYLIQRTSIHWISDRT